MTSRRMKFKAKLERQKVIRSVSKFRGAAMALAKYDRFRLAEMKRAHAESNALAERMARDAD
jgi:hypothetical protein